MALVLERNVALQSMNAFGVAATASWLARARCAADLEVLQGEPRVAGLPRLVLGGGTNFLFVSDFPGLVIRVEETGLARVGETDDRWLFEAGAGEPWHAMVERLLDMGAAGLENLALIPGTVGGQTTAGLPDGAFRAIGSHVQHSVL